MEYSTKFLNDKDKGKTGKYSEFSLFGNLPNSKSGPDLPNGYEVKTTHFKKMKKNANLYNAKNKITISSFGNNGIESIQNTDSLEDLHYYDKMRKGVVLIFEYTPVTGKPVAASPVTTVLEKIENSKLLTIFTYDLQYLNKGDQEVLKTDFIKIKTSIEKKKIGQKGQKGQKYLQMIKKKSKNETYTFGFSNRFSTKLVSIFCNKRMVKNKHRRFVRF